MERERSSNPPGQSRRLWPGLILCVSLSMYVWKWSADRAHPLQRFQTAIVQRGDITALVSATGALEALTTVTVGSQVSGQVRQVLVDFNSPVQKGQILALLDPSEFQARLEEAEAGLQGAEAGLDTARARWANSRSAVSQAQAQLDAARNSSRQSASVLAGARANLQNSRAVIAKARAELDNALLDYRRYDELNNRRLVAVSEGDQKRTAYRVAEASYTSSLANQQSSQAQLDQNQAQLLQAQNAIATAQARLDAEVSNVAAARAEIEAASARRRQSEAGLQRARVDLRRTVLRSPVNGTVIDRKLEPGQTVAASFTAPELFKIARDLRQMQVRADVSEADIGRVSEGQKVTFKVDAYPEKTFQGRVTQVRSAPVANQNNVVVYAVLISAPNPNRLLKPGMTATVAIAVEERKQVLVVPDDALRFLPPHPQPDGGADEEAIDPLPKGRPGVVWRAGAKGPERVDVGLGIGNGRLFQVLGGNLKEGDAVYTKVLATTEEPIKERSGYGPGD